MGWIGCVRCEKSRCDFVARTFAIIALVQPILHRVSCSYETIPNAPKYYETDQNICLGSNGWIRCVRCKKLQCDFVGRTFVSIALVQYVLHPLSCTYEMIPNAPKYYELHQNISLGSNGVGLVCSLQKNPNVTSLHKIPMWLRVTNFCINCTSSVCFASSFMQLRNNPKCTEILWNRPKH